MIIRTTWILLLSIAFSLPVSGQEPLESIRVSADGKRFVRESSDEEFIVWGVNYDHGSTGTGRLLDEYWGGRMETVVADFREIKELGANCVRIDLQLASSWTLLTWQTLRRSLAWPNSRNWLKKRGSTSR